MSFKKAFFSCKKWHFDNKTFD